MNAAELALERIRALCEQHGYSGATSNGELLLWLERQLSELDRRRVAAADVEQPSPDREG
jgi:hypothetical protein